MLKNKFKIDCITEKLRTRGVQVDIRILQATDDDLLRYRSVPITFDVRTMLEPEWAENGFGGLLLREKQVIPSYVKNYDAESAPLYPATAPHRENFHDWAAFVAECGDQLVGGAVVVLNTVYHHSMDARKDVAVVEDIRVHPDYRRQNIGTGLFGQTVAWARDRECRRLMVETQNVNVPACRFYVSQGCRLGAINLYGYAGGSALEENEIMLTWYLDL